MTDKEPARNNDNTGIAQPEQEIVEVSDQTADETAEQAQQESSAELLAAALQEAQTNLEGWQRTLAEFQNYKKRVERETRESYQKASLDMLVKLLPIIDDFERGLSNIPAEFAGHAWIEGIRLVQRKFTKMLDEYEVVAVDPVGEVFDPTRHEAVGVVSDTDIETGHVAETLQKGYACGDRILRPALVRVAG